MFAADFFEFARKADAHCRVRFAPTPSGFLHIGNALNFTLNWLVARLQGGKILLRIDDLDGDRKRPEYLEDIFESLRWLGLDWDEGPGVSSTSAPVLDFEENWSQNGRLAAYYTLLDRLRDQKLLFPCRQSRSTLAAFAGKYPIEFRNQACGLDDPDVAWRIITPEDAGLNDFVVRRRDGVPAYQVASFADDLTFGITHVVRGADLEDSTSAQNFLAACLNENKFLEIKFLHHPLLLDNQGEKLSKSAGASSLKALRETGAGPAQVMEKVGQLLGLASTHSAAALLDTAGAML